MLSVPPNVPLPQQRWQRIGGGTAGPSVAAAETPFPEQSWLASPYVHNEDGRAMSTLQMQYNEQLVHYRQQQRQYEEWSKRFLQQQKLYSEQEQGYDEYQNMFQQEQLQPGKRFLDRQQPERRHFSSLMQTSSESAATAAAAVAAREQRVAAEEQKLAAAERREAEERRSLEMTEGVMQKKEQQLWNKELADQRFETQLTVRASAMAKKGKQLQVLETQLIQEQRKLWRAKHAKAARARGSSAGRSAAAGNTPVPGKEVSNRGLAVPPPQQLPAGPAMQVEPGEAAQRRVTILPMSAIQTATRTAGNARRQLPGEIPGSDLHVVVAARAPPPLVGRSGAIAQDSSKAAPRSDEDSVPAQREEQRGEFADNDDLEQVLLQRASRHRSGPGDAVELS